MRKNVFRFQDVVISSIKIVFPKSYFLVTFLILIIPIAISYGDVEPHLTVVNKTDHFLHVIIDGNSFLYVSAGSAVDYESEAKSDYLVRAFYSPGQGITAGIDRTIAVEYHARSTGCDYSSSGGCECSTNPASAGASIWEITPDTMLTTDE